MVVHVNWNDELEGYVISYNVLDMDKIDPVIYEVRRQVWGVDAIVFEVEADFAERDRWPNLSAPLRERIAMAIIGSCLAYKVLSARLSHAHYGCCSGRRSDYRCRHEPPKSAATVFGWTTRDWAIFVGGFAVIVGAIGAGVPVVAGWASRFPTPVQEIFELADSFI